MLAANQAVARRLFYQVIRQKHHEILLQADTDTVSRSTITASVGSMSDPIEIERPKNFRPSSMGTILRRHPAPLISKMDELVREIYI